MSSSTVGMPVPFLKKQCFPGGSILEIPSRGPAGRAACPSLYFSARLVSNHTSPANGFIVYTRKARMLGEKPPRSQGLF